ncbi:MAG: TadE family protein [Candidatus Baltobacteraceae bacterium]
MQIALRQHGQRGQALIETAIVLPLFLLLVYGVMWIVRSGVVNERVQIAVRYSGLVSSQASPYIDYSMYALYNNLEGIGAPPVAACGPPTTDALDNNGQFLGPPTSPYWLPGATNGACTAGHATLQGGAIVQPEVFTHTLSSITSQTPIEGVLSTALGQNAQQVAASQNYLDAPGIGTVLVCYPDIDDAVSASLQNTAPILPVNSIVPLADVLPTTPINLSGSC